MTFDGGHGISSKMKITNCLDVIKQCVEKCNLEQVAGKNVVTQFEKRGKGGKGRKGGAEPSDQLAN